jgi:hypothetical protein
MLVRRQAPGWLQALAVLVGFALSKILFQFTIPIGPGIVGIIAFAIVFIGPLILVNWLAARFFQR